MIPQIILLSWTSLFSMTMAAGPINNQAPGYTTVTSQKNLQAQLSSIEDKLRHIEDVRSWNGNSRLNDVLRRIDSLDSRMARIESFLERKMDGIQDKLAYLEGKLETRLDKIQVSLDTVSTRSDRGMKLVTNKVVDLERTVQNIKHYCNASAISVARGFSDPLQMQNGETSMGTNGPSLTDNLVEKINKKIILHISNVTNKLNGWYNELWRRSNSLELTVKNDNNQTRWEVYDGIMQILSRWEITDEAMRELENNMKDHFADSSSTHTEILRSFSDKENKLAGILDGFLTVLVYNATQAFSQIQLTQELIKSHNSHMVRTIDTTNKLVLSCQEDNKALKGALLLTGAQYKLEWDKKHDRLRSDIGVTQTEINNLQKQILKLIEENNSNNTGSNSDQTILGTLRSISDKMSEVTKSLSTKCPDEKNSSISNNRDITDNKTMVINDNQIEETVKLTETSPDIFTNLNEPGKKILGNATQVYNFLSGFVDSAESDERDVTEKNKRRLESSTLSSQSSSADYADSFGPDNQDYDDAEEEYIE